MSRLISTHTAVAMATTALALVSGTAIAQTVGKAAAVNPAASSGGKMLTLGSEIIHKQRINTDAGGSLQLLFIDRTTLNIGPNSNLVIDEYVFDPNTNTGKMALSLGKGVMRFVGGQVSHNGNASVKTPSATIGIRGAVGSFSYDPQTKITSASNDCTNCVLTLTARTGQTVSIPPGHTATVQSDGSIKIAPTTQADSERNLRSTQSKGNQKGGGGEGTSNQATNYSNQLPPPPPPPQGFGAGFGNNSTLNNLLKDQQTSTGNAGANSSATGMPTPPTCAPYCY